MELLSIADVVRRRRILLAVGVVLAVVVGAMAAGLLPPGSAGAASGGGQALAQVVVDTRVPLLATTAPGGDATIVQRSVLLADLMQTTPMTATIAQRAGIPAADLGVVGPVLPPEVQFSLVPDGQFPQLAAAAALTALHTPEAVQLVPNLNVPVMAIATNAPTVRAAVALAQATIATLKSATVPTSTDGKAASKPALNIEPLGNISSAAVPASGSVHLTRGVAAALALLAAWCSGVVIAAGLARRWRQVGRPAPSAAG
ncbi:MAG TPA: hypothetical protein VG294_03105 [Solirubrobacteraceae bacterium]|jgi:hypothetical protein|nr:hypothetical protein [Solirubrobacteraceae bacterium]